MSFQQIKLQKNKAFTLIELMVATTIFTIVMLMGVGSLVTTSNSAKAAQKLQIAVDNVNFAMESMTRELRMGTNYYGGTGTLSMLDSTAVMDYTNGEVILFKPQQIGSPLISRVGYFRDLRNDGTHTLNRCVDDGSHCYSIVADNVDVQVLNFTVLGSYLSPVDNIQPSVRIIMKGVVNVGGGTSFTLQTMASQRSAEK
jgi:prepilin-type N-terminal cleavage/methylation domain-containing protein